MKPRVPLFACALSLTVALFAACGETTGSPADESGASGGTAGADGTGGAPSGGTSSGGTVAGVGGGVATMTEEEWQEALAPRTGPHEVWTEDECQQQGPGSSSVLIEAAHQVVPPEHCAVTPTYPEDHKHQCVVSPYCETSADCTEGSRGRCEGVLQEAYCYYPGLPAEACDEDADCTAAPDGDCPAEEGQFQTLCYPTGECVPPVPHCFYPALSGAPCQEAADCTAIPGGECILPIAFTSCRYDTCFEDEDCDAGDRCGCGTCVPADCTGNADCPEDETCELSAPTCGREWSFHCTTPEDECVPEDQSCLYENGAWRDDDVLCERG